MEKIGKSGKIWDLKKEEKKKSSKLELSLRELKIIRIKKQRFLLFLMPLFEDSKKLISIGTLIRV